MPGLANILVVDDRPDKRLVLDTLLQPLGQPVVSVGSGEEALKEMLEREFAVILLDVNMPGMDGLETAALIRQRKKTAHTPIIFITAYADEMHTARGYSLGAVDYILAPIIPNVLRTKVKVFVDLFLMAGQAKERAEERIALAHEQAARMAAEETTRHLQEAAARKDEFLAMLSHELRNPMAAIRSSVGLLMTATDDPAAVKFATNIIDRQSHQLTHLVDDLLDISRITRGKIALRTEVFDLTRAVHSGVETNRFFINARKHQLTMLLPDEPVPIRGDYARIVQIVANLVHNAAKYTEEEGEITIAATPNPDTAEIRVRDSGIGIPDDKLADIFTPFTQLAPHSKVVDGSQGGLGVGLTLVKILTELHGGTVQAHSAGLNCGSEFVVRLPMAIEIV